MRYGAWTGLVLVVAGGLVLGCAQKSVLSAEEADQQLMQLVARADDLRAKLAAETGTGAAHRPEFDRLAADVKAWRARTGRTDAGVTTESGREPSTSPLASGGGPVGDDGCRPCPGYQVWPDHVCFLVEEGPCDEDPDSIIMRVCVYECIWIGSGPKSEGVKTEPYKR
jgi:hypothetical protein